MDLAVNTKPFGCASKIIKVAFHFQGLDANNHSDKWINTWRYQSSQFGCARVITHLVSGQAFSESCPSKLVGSQKKKHDFPVNDEFKPCQPCLTPLWSC